MKHTDFENIIEASHKLTGSKAQTREGAWRALRVWIQYKPKFDRTKTHYNYDHVEALSLCRPGPAHGDPRQISPRKAWKIVRWRKRAERGAETIMKSMNQKSRWEDLYSGSPLDPWNLELSKTRRFLNRDQYGALYMEKLQQPWGGVAEYIRHAWLSSPGASPAGLVDAWDCVRNIETNADEHGGWEERSEWDKKGRGEQISVDLYGIDSAARLYVIQVRQSFRQRKGYFLSVRKSYFLIGWNENGNSFAHAVGAGIVHAAIKRDPSPESPVRAAQSWIWGIEESRLPEVLRNGDVALIPVKSAPKKDVEIDTTGKRRIIDSHWIYSREIRINGAVYAIDPTLRHMKGQHPTQKGKGWFRVVVGRRADHHDFARPTMD